MAGRTFLGSQHCDISSATPQLLAIMAQCGSVLMAATVKEDDLLWGKSVAGPVISDPDTHKPAAAAAANLPFPQKPSIKSAPGRVDIGAIVTGWAEASGRRAAIVTTAGHTQPQGHYSPLNLVFTHSLMELWVLNHTTVQPFAELLLWQFRRF